jgi:hypothetical protein
MREKEGNEEQTGRGIMEGQKEENSERKPTCFKSL